MEKRAALVGGAIGALTSVDMPEKYCKALKKHYELDDDANLVLRNAGRGALGEIGGGIVGNVLAAPLVRKAIEHENPGLAALALLEPAGTGLLGSYLASRKYSRERARELLDN